MITFNFNSSVRLLSDASCSLRLDDVFNLSREQLFLVYWCRCVCCACRSRGVPSLRSQICSDIISVLNLKTGGCRRSNSSFAIFSTEIYSEVKCSLSEGFNVFTLSLGFAGGFNPPTS